MPAMDQNHLLGNICNSSCSCRNQSRGIAASRTEFVGHVMSDDWWLDAIWCAYFVCVYTYVYHISYLNSRIRWARCWTRLLQHLYTSEWFNHVTLQIHLVCSWKKGLLCCSWYRPEWNAGPDDRSARHLSFRMFRSIFDIWCAWCLVSWHPPTISWILLTPKDGSIRRSVRLKGPYCS